MCVCVCVCACVCVCVCVCVCESEAELKVALTCVWAASRWLLQQANKCHSDNKLKENEKNKLLEAYSYLNTYTTYNMKY